MPDERCDVQGCGKDAARSVPSKSAAGALTGLPSKARRVHLCKEHYKTVKKYNKEKRGLERLGWE
jgi:hypothetical protein